MAKSTAITWLFQEAGLSGWYTLNALYSIACKLEEHHETIFENLIGVNNPLQTSSYKDPLNSYWCIISAPIAHFVLTAYFLAQTIHYFGIAAWEGDSEYLKIALTSFLTAILSAILIMPSFVINLFNKIYDDATNEASPINKIYDDATNEASPKEALKIPSQQIYHINVEGSEGRLSKEALKIPSQQIDHINVDDQSFSDVSDLFDFLWSLSSEFWEASTNNFYDMMGYVQSSNTYANEQGKITKTF